MPYDQFLTWQLAGDMLPDPTREQLIATCFLRNHPQTQEGGVVDEEYRVEYVADRTNTFGKAFLGLTMECARCHDHKYDPLSQKDYYSLYAYFNNNHDAGIVPYNGEASPTLILTSSEADKELSNLKTLIDQQDELLVTDQYKEAVVEWSKSLNKNQKTKRASFGLVADFNFDEEYK